MRITTSHHGMNVQAPAKLNLSLLVLGKRPDGFHELDTVMVSLQLYDTLRFVSCQSDQVSLQMVGASAEADSIPTDDRNLVIQAAKRLQHSANVAIGADITLTKRIPSQAGLGGGSSDAAATLVALNQLWNLNLPSPELHRLAAQLGSDVNFFLDSHVAARCTGRGEEIAPIPISQPLYFVLIKPPAGLSTGRVFQAWKSKSQSGLHTPLQDVIVSRLQSNSLFQVSQGIHNSLEAPAVELSEEVRTTLSLLKQQNLAAVGMSGSGTTCFGLCSSWNEAKRMATKLRSQTKSRVWAAKSGI